jgi:hypothetical protein
MQTELEKWIDFSKVTESTVIVGEKSQCFGDLVEPMIPERLVRALLAGKMLCGAEPVAWHYQTPTSGMWKEGVSLYKPVHPAQMIKPLYAPAESNKPVCTHAPAQMTTQWDHGIEIGNPFCIKCGGSISKEIDHE